MTAFFDFRFTICDLRGIRGYPPRLSQAGRGFRCSLRSQRNGGGRRRKQGGRWAAREKTPATARPSPPPISPFFSPLAAHHSAKRGSVERNLPICGVRFAICEVRFTKKVYGLKFQVFSFKSSVSSLKSMIRCMRYDRRHIQPRRGSTHGVQLTPYAVW